MEFPETKTSPRTKAEHLDMTASQEPIRRRTEASFDEHLLLLKSTAKRRILLRSEVDALSQDPRGEITLRGIANSQPDCVDAFKTGHGMH